MPRKRLLRLGSATEIKSPPFSKEGRIEAGRLLQDLQEGKSLSLPESRPMPSIGRRVHELRLQDPTLHKSWRLIYRIDPEAILLLYIFEKRTTTTPQNVKDICKRKLSEYDWR